LAPTARRLSTAVARRAGEAARRRPARDLKVESLEPRIALAADTVSRPLLELAEGVSVDPSMMGPAAIVFGKSEIVGHDVKSFVVTSVANGVVEKWDTAKNAWVDVSTKPTSSNPRELMSLLAGRVIHQGDQLRWLPAAGDTAAVRKAFEIIGWDDGTELQPTSSAAPTAVQNLAVTPTGVGQLTLAWDAPATGTPTSYSVAMNNGTTTTTTITTSTSMSFTGLSATMPAYTFTVTATNAAGSGPAATATSFVNTGSSSLVIPVSPEGFVTSADWYFPTQADGQVSASGFIWLQRAETNDAAAFATLAVQIAWQTNSIVVSPAISSFEIPTQPGYFLGGAALQQAVADMMLGDRAALSISANNAGYQGVLPEKFLLTGQRLGGGFAAEVAARTVGNGAAANLLGVVMVDGVADPDQFAAAVDTLDDAGIPLYQIASPPQAGNAWGNTTELLAALQPYQFVGVQFDDISPVNAVITFATGWINDFYAGCGPTNPFYGLYSNPNDGTYVANRPLVLGVAGVTVLPAPPTVDINQYAGRWYEQGSVKQEPATGLVNIETVFTPQPDGTITVENYGTYGPNGPVWETTGSAVPVNAANTRLSVSSSGAPSTDEPGNYWILDYAPNYSWAIVSDPTKTSGTILTRGQFPSFYQTSYDALVARAYQLGVRGTITPTVQYPAIPPG
jgi:lipocalin